MGNGVGEIICDVNGKNVMGLPTPPELDIVGQRGGDEQYYNISVVRKI